MALIIIIIIIIIITLVSSVFSFMACSLSKITIGLYPQRTFFVSVHRWINHLENYLKVRILKFSALF
jgi:CBS domain containing-hemolysin-like protein